MSIYDDRRRENSQNRTPPAKRPLTVIDVIEHRFWLATTGVPLGYLDFYANRFAKTFV